MKKYILYLLAFLFVGLSVTGCSDDDDNTCPATNGIAGEWRMVSWSDSPAEGVNIYLNLTPCSTFELFQKVGTLNYVKYTGQYTAEGTTLSGTYSDGEPWSAAYNYTLSEDGNTLTLVTVSEPVEKSVYTRTIIPDDVRNAMTSRSAEVKRAL